MGTVRLDDIEGFGPEVDATLRQWREGIEGANNWAVGGWAEYFASPAGHKLIVHGGRVGKVAKTGGTAIAAMSGTTPGVGEITLYTLGSTLAVGPPEIAYNIAPEEVAADTWVVVMWVDNEWLIIYEICPA